MKLPNPIRRRVEREIYEALHRKGMSTHDGRTRISACDAVYMLKLIDKLSEEVIPKAADISELKTDNSEDTKSDKL